MIRLPTTNCDKRLKLSLNPFFGEVFFGHFSLDTIL